MTGKMPPGMPVCLLYAEHLGDRPLRASFLSMSTSTKMLQELQSSTDKLTSNYFLLREGVSNGYFEGLQPLVLHQKY